MANQYQKDQSQLDILNQNIGSIYEYVHFQPHPKAVSSVDNLGYYAQSNMNSGKALPMTLLDGVYTKKDCEYNAALNINNAYANSYNSYYALVESPESKKNNHFRCYVATTEKNPDFETAIQQEQSVHGIIVWSAFRLEKNNEKKLLDANNYLLLGSNGDLSIYNNSNRNIKTLAVGKDYFDPSGNILPYNSTVSLEDDGVLYWTHPVSGKKAISQVDKSIVSQYDSPSGTNVIWQMEMRQNKWNSQLDSVSADGTYNKMYYGSSPIVSNNGIYRMEFNRDGNLVIKMYVEKPFHKVLENGETVYYTGWKENGDQDFYPYSVKIDPKMSKTFLSMNYPSKDGKLIQTMNYIPPDHPNFQPTTNYDAVENVYSSDGIVQGGVFSNSDVTSSCKKICDDSPTCQSYNILSSLDPKFQNKNVCLIRDKKVENRITIDKSDPRTKFTSTLYIKKNKPMFMENDIRKLVPLHSTTDYVSYNNYNIDMNPYTTGLGSYYDNLVKERNLLYQGKEGLTTMDSSSNLNYMKTNEFYKMYGNPGSQNNVKDAIQNHQLEPSVQNTSAYESKLYTINSNYYSLNDSLHTITNSTGTGLRDVMMKDPKYDFSGNVFQYDHPILTRTDGILDDIQTMTVHENSIYILGAITSATLLIGAIVMSSD